MSNRDNDRMTFFAIKIRAGVPLSAHEQAYWDANALLGDRVAAGLPITPEEQAGMDRAKESVVTLRGGLLWVEDAKAPKTIADWEAVVERERAEGGWIPRPDNPMTDK